MFNCLFLLALHALSLVGSGVMMMKMKGCCGLPPACNSVCKPDIAVCFRHYSTVTVVVTRMGVQAILTSVSNVIFHDMIYRVFGYLFISPSISILTRGSVSFLENVVVWMT